MIVARKKSIFFFLQQGSARFARAFVQRPGHVRRHDGFVTAQKSTLCSPLHLKLFLHDRFNDDDDDDCNKDNDE